MMQREVDAMNMIASLEWRKLPVLRLVEIYTSVQGEGPNTGEPTTFVRFGGCNLRCPGWGMGTLPDGTPVPGCDTTFAVYPQWSKTWGREEVANVVENTPSTPQRICLTGGEPLIQPAESLDQYVGILTSHGHTFDLFTNGTQTLPRWAQRDNVTVVMDWKMPSSGEYGKFNENNLVLLSDKDAVKFVCGDRADFDKALECARYIESVGNAGPSIWFGVVWGVLDPAQLVEWVLAEYPQGRLNLQTHKYVWDPEERER